MNHNHFEHHLLHLGFTFTGTTGMRSLLLHKARLVLIAMCMAGIGLIHGASVRRERSELPVSQDLAGYPYNGSVWTFVRIQTNAGYGQRFGRRFGGWAHDYPDAEINLTKIISEITKVPVRRLEYGGNVFAFDDPRLFLYPIAYVSEPDEWTVTESEAKGLRAYLLKGGFVIFDDFFEYEMANLVAQMSNVFPELQFQRLQGDEPIWKSFFEIEPGQVVLEGPRKSGTPVFWGLYEQNNRNRRLLAIAGAGGDIGDLWEWSGRGFYPVGPTDHAFRIGVNYIVHALSH